MNKTLLAELEWIAFQQDKPLDVVIEEYSRTDTHLRDTGSSSLVQIYKNDTPGQGAPVVNVLKKIAKDKHAKLNKFNKKNTEAQFN